jgi:23S rRNA pseudouridine2605 synthase
MRDRPFRTPRAPRLDWPGGIVPEWAKAPKSKKFQKGSRGKGGPRERLQKVMAQSGHGSRRNLEILIAQGHITINGDVAKLGDLVGPGDRVKLDGKLISLRFGTSRARVLLYHTQ